MKFRLISRNADGVSIALKLAKEGHEADFWVKNPRAKKVYHGIMAQAESWNAGLEPDSLILFDNTGFGNFAEQLKKDGSYVFGSGQLNDVLVQDSDFGMKIARLGKMKMPAYGVFEDREEAKDFVKRSGKAWVIKGFYEPESCEDTIFMLNFLKDIKAFVLIEKMRGVKVSIGGYYVDGSLVEGSLNSSIEIRGMFNKNMGPQVSMGSVTWFWKSKRPKLYKLTLKKIEDFLKRFRYKGSLNCICVVNEEDRLPYFLEFDTLLLNNIIFEGIAKTGDFLMAMCKGEQPKFRRSYNWLGSVRINTTPIPDRPVWGLDDHTWPLDIKANHDHLLTAGYNGIVGDVTASAKNLTDLEDRLYKRAEKLKVQDKMYRTDIVKSARRQIYVLKKWKYF